MGISFDVQATKPDYSHLFSSVGSAAGNAASSNWLGDYAAIKNGSYGKLMKAYYADSKEKAHGRVRVQRPPRKAVKAMFWTGFWRRRGIQRSLKRPRRQMPN